MDFIPFSEDELKIIEYVNGWPKLNTPITPKENLLRCARRENPLWIPLRTDEVNFCPRIIPDNVARAFVLEQNKYEGPVGGKDMFGIDWMYIDTVGGSMVKPGQPALEDISDWKEVIQFPDINSWDWEGSAKENEEFLKDDRLIVAWFFSGLFERLISWMDFENAAIALIDEDMQEDCHALFQALVDLYKDILTNMKKYYNIDAVFFHDDWGSQRAPFFSVDICREMIAPYLKQLVDHCHEIGILFDLHSCGMIEPLVPVMIECGCDKWGGQPLNDKTRLIAEYGDKIMIGATDTIPGAPGQASRTGDELKEAVNDFFERNGKNLPENTFFLMNFGINEEEIKEVYKAGRLAMEKSLLK